MKRCTTLLSFLLVIGVTLPALADLKIVATVPDLGALARDIGGEHVDVTVMANHAEDPHWVDPRPSHLVALNRADMLVYNGADLEVGWLPPLVLQSRNPGIQVGTAGHFDASQSVTLTEVPVKSDRALGDVHPAGNPHYTLDAQMGAKLAVQMGERMARLDPDHAAAYRDRAGGIANKLQAFAAAQRDRFAKLPGERRRIVTYHKSLTYLIAWLDLSLVNTVEPKPGIAPTPGHTAKVLRAMKSGSVRVLVQERHYPKSTSQTLCKLTGAKLVLITGQARFVDGQSYFDHLQELTDALYTALSE